MSYQWMIASLKGYKILTVRITNQSLPMGAPFLNVYHEYPLITKMTLSKQKVMLRQMIIMKVQKMTQKNTRVLIMFMTAMIKTQIITTIITTKIQLINILTLNRRILTIQTPLFNNQKHYPFHTSKLVSKPKMSVYFKNKKKHRSITHYIWKIKDR